MTLVRWLVLALAVIAVACAPQGDDPTTTSSLPATTTTTLDPSAPPCLTGDFPFTSDGPVAALGEDAGDATVLAGVRWERYSGCERLVFDFFNDDGAPASTLGPAGAIALGESGILRVTLPDGVATSAVADTLLDGALAEALYVARDAAGALFVDVHLGGETAVGARAFEVVSPIRLVVDLRSEDEPTAIVGAATTSSDVVVITPTPGAALYPLRVLGYARPDAGAVRVRLAAGGVVEVERSAPTSGPSDVWKTFEVRLPDGPSGPVELAVGPVDAFGELVNAVTIPLELP